MGGVGRESVERWWRGDGTVVSGGGRWTVGRLSEGRRRPVEAAAAGVRGGCDGARPLWLVNWLVRRDGGAVAAKA
eukprot:CAMPEP_0174699212 /NCGR_PEP_ID=MMETSP1094-20130205/4563_1 /TAXON_ID=156173 /ORGANISM="Chrysochromulina brevifilum, Strain UTEX LB 985" /LENGTH=74 /DNA_ID=CAMNT_0015896497 /DNA_START=247 /DNA_END=471 /DNA_ORIENTATION=+